MASARAGAGSEERHDDRPECHGQVWICMPIGYVKVATADKP